jgi:carbon storage regulator CsrA
MKFYRRQFNERDKSMLVLSRKTNETIVIDGRITLEVLQIKGNQIRIGINAPADVRILRGELKPFGMEDSRGPQLEMDVEFDMFKVG